MTIVLVHDPNKGCLNCPLIDVSSQHTECRGLNGRALDMYLERPVPSPDCPLRKPQRHGGGVLVVPPVERTPNGIPVSEYNPRLSGEALVKSIENAPEGSCCDNEKRGWNGGCENCGDPCF